ncbi:hypothetical protein PGTUg99_011535 [Puccinia graminis f. sp. tritici]|uniref:Uncharacterized protein n=1 Tax=Puccinia graminis f. sp. tritici TaxID=56615 RepID=A0A5B0SNR9_PUCGR|nr:hypothetical protein PGTUg99_011535 [Puccinia graminis f. sp. tritici]
MYNLTSHHKLGEKSPRCAQSLESAYECTYTGLGSRETGKACKGTVLAVGRTAALWSSMGVFTSETDLCAAYRLGDQFPRCRPHPFLPVELGGLVRDGDKVITLLPEDSIPRYDTVKDYVLGSELAVNYNSSWKVKPLHQMYFEVLGTSHKKKF